LIDLEYDIVLLVSLSDGFGQYLHNKLKEKYGCFNQFSVYEMPYGGGLVSHKYIAKKLSTDKLMLQQALLGDSAVTIQIALAIENVCNSKSTTVALRFVWTTFVCQK
jgi:hypothetical protein